MRYLFQLITLSFVLSFLMAPSSFACSCVVSTLTEGFENADLVFVGTSTDIQTNDWGNEITFSVEEVRKGEKNETFVIQSSLSSAACGIDFVEGETYLVYATALNENSYETGLCTPTRLYYMRMPATPFWHTLERL